MGSCFYVDIEDVEPIEKTVSNIDWDERVRKFNKVIDSVQNQREYNNFIKSNPITIIR